MTKNDLFRRVYLGFLVGLGLLILASPSFHQLGIVNDHAPQLSIFFLCLGLWAYIRNKRDALLISFGLSSLVIVMLKNESESAYNSNVYEENLEPIKITLLNLSNFKNSEHLAFELANNKDEMICFLEVTPQWNSVIKDLLKTKYPFSFSAPAIDIFGKSIYSKNEMTQIDTINYIHHNDYVLNFKGMKGKYTALVTHIIPALDPNSQKQAQNQLDIIAKKVNFNLAPTVVIGEFNQVHWSKDLKGFKQKSKLSNCRKESSLTNLSISRMMSFHNEGLKCLSLRDIKNKDGENYGIQASYNLIEANPALGIANPRPFK